ncbi:MAG: N-6 DNA methylase [Anaeromyxobacter sp.]
MAPRKKLRQREAQLAFEALSIEGSLISPEWLAKVAQLGAGHQAEADYRIPKGLNLRDEIGRYWRMAQAHWADFARAWSVGTAGKPVAEQFVTALLRDCFAFGSLVAKEPVAKGERIHPIGWTALEGRVPVVIVAPRPPGDPATARRSALDDLSPDLGDEGRRRSAFGLAQEYLNAEDDALWAIACDGLTLRICRDNASLTRPAWVEADLARLFTEERYADFAALWLLAHESRFGAAGQPASACHLEAWRSAGREEGTRAREFLRDGVEEALKALGKGFLANPENQALRTALHDGTLSQIGFFQELLRLAYRLIFLLTAEERELLHPEGVSDAVKARYAHGYSVRRLRDRSVKRSAHDRFGDLWEGLNIVLRGAGAGEPRLGLPALGGLFAPDQCPHLDAARLENRALLTAVFRLSWLKGEAGLTRVNWRDMGPEELGSVYESLLELVPVIPPDYRGFSFATGDDTKGNARKTTGSYYTPDSLVQVLLDSALEPVVKETIAKNPGNPAEALLQLTVVDPACGSGHFLLAAARRLAIHVARLQANGTPSAAEYRHALRQVASRCLFGVDLNPMAVELCRVGLWMEAVEPGRPLSFLDAHIQRGNALLGATPELMAKGIPDEAFEAIEGDDKKTASLLKKKNKAAAEGQRGLDALWSKPAEAESAEVSKAVAALEAAPDASLEEVAGKEAQWEGLQRSFAFTHQKFIADAWCAAFVWPKPPTDPKKSDPVVSAAPTNDLWRQIRDGQGKPPAETVKTVAELTSQYHFFHWHLSFPQVFARGGFDVVLGNPPWERVKLSEQEFFASRSDAIALASNAAQRKKLIAALPSEDPTLWREWSSASRTAVGLSHFVRESDRYPLCGKGDVNLYALFAEHNISVLRSGARAGFIAPTGIATDDTTKAYFQMLVETRRLRSLYDFQSGPGLFGEIGHGTFKFSLVTVSADSDPTPASLSFYARSVREALSSEKVFSLASEDIEALNPNTRTCPTFRSHRDAVLNLLIYRRTGVLWDEEADAGNFWRLRFLRMFDMTNDAGMFLDSRALSSKAVQGQRVIPLLEAKMVHQFDHRYGDYKDQPEGSENLSLPDVTLDRLVDPAYAPQPRYWVLEHECEQRLEGWQRGWLLGWRDISKTQNERTCVASLLPRVAVANNFPLALTDAEPKLVACLYANLSAAAFDYCVRQKAGGTHLNYFILKQLPVLHPDIYAASCTWGVADTVRDWALQRILELTYTAWSLEPFAKDIGYDGPPFRWAPERRFLLRAELDAAFFHLYGISRDDADYILETFPIVKKNDEKAHGEYRTKRVILEIYEAIAEAIRTRKPYQTRLDPPPSDPRVAHPARSGSRPASAGRSSGRG